MRLLRDLFTAVNNSVNHSIIEYSYVKIEH